MLSSIHCVCQDVISWRRRSRRLNRNCVLPASAPTPTKRQRRNVERHAITARTVTLDCVWVPALSDIISVWSTEDNIITTVILWSALSFVLCIYIFYENVSFIASGMFLIFRAYISDSRCCCISSDRSCSRKIIRRYTPHCATSYWTLKGLTLNSFCEEVYAVAFFKVAQQQTIGKVGNSIMGLWADNFCL